MQTPRNHYFRKIFLPASISLLIPALISCGTANSPDIEIAKATSEVHDSGVVDSWDLPIVENSKLSIESVMTITQNTVTIVATCRAKNQGETVIVQVTSPASVTDNTVETLTEIQDLKKLQSGETCKAYLKKGAMDYTVNGDTLVFQSSTSGASLTLTRSKSQ